MRDKSFLTILKNAKIELIDEIQTTKFIDSGCYLFNALLSGSIYGGIPSNRTVMLAGDPSSGKTYLALSILKIWQELFPTGQIIYYDTEFALDKKMVGKRGIDVERFHIQQPETLQDFRTSCLNLIDSYEAEKSNIPLFLVLDSLGQLPTKKEIEDSKSGAETRDMTKAQIIKSIFRILTLKLGKNNIPMIVTNHTYDSMSMYSPKEISGGCLIAGTKITMADNTLRSIEDVEIGELVKTLDGPQKVLNSWTPDTLDEGYTDCIRLSFEDGTSVTCSKSHKFLIDGDWVEARNLLVGNDLM